MRLLAYAVGPVLVALPTLLVLWWAFGNLSRHL
jgi:hypothetical protein